MADEIAVTIEPELPLPEEKDVVVKTEPERDDKGKFKAKDPAVDDLKAQFAELKERSEKDKETEKTRREAAERRATQATQDALRARQEAEVLKTAVVEGQSDTVTQGLSAAQAEAESATQEYTSAMEAGDFTKAAKAQRRIANAEAKIVRLDEAKSDIEAQRTQRQQRIEAPQQNIDPVEAYIQNRTEPTANWLREHREWISDSKKNAKLTAAHHDAISEGLSPDTKEYFDHVEEFIGLNKKDEVKPNGSQKRKSSSAPVAPVSDSGGGVSGSSNEVRLSASEARAAQDGTHVWNYDDQSGQKKFKKGEPIGIQEMARRKQIMEKQGFYSRDYTES